jgi:hypothetical protein
LLCIADGLGERHELSIRERQQLGEFGMIDGSAKNRAEFFRGAEQV